MDALACGGQHTVALTKNGACYSWGSGEGGQLGIPFNLLTQTNDGMCYLTTPKKIKSVLEGIVIKQVDCGDAHSIALSSTG